MKQFDYSEQSLKNKRIQQQVITQGHRAAHSLCLWLFVRPIFPILCVITATLGFFAYGFWVELYDSTLKYDLTHHILTGQSSIVLDNNGDELYRFEATQNREFVSIDRLPDHVWQAFVSMEDERMFLRGPEAEEFFNKIGWGWDFRGTVRATLATLLGGTRQGGSTIAQQVLRATVLEWDSGEGTIITKAREILVADRFMQELYEVYNHDLKAVNLHIIETYMNSINFGGNMHSIAVASQFYFNKPATELTISEAAVLVALLPAPSRLNPVRNPEGNRERQEIVIKYMYRDGYITFSEMQEALADPVHERVSNYQTSFVDDSIRPWFIDSLFESLRDDIIELGYAKNEDQASNLIHNGGLVIHTSFDPEIQNIMDSIFLNEDNWPGASEYLLQYRLSYNDEAGELHHVNYQNIVVPTEADVQVWRDARIDQYIGRQEVTRVIEYEEQVGTTRSLKAAPGVVDGPVGVGEEVRVFRGSDELYRFPIVDEMADESWGSVQIFEAVLEYYGEQLEVVERPLYEKKTREETTLEAPEGRIVDEYLSAVINPQAASVILENGTARILGITGARGPKEANMAFNRAYNSRRSTGSASKGMFYSFALESGLLTPESIVDDKPWSVVLNGKKWEPHNYSGGYTGKQTVLNAYANSVNTIPARLTQDELGAENLYNFMLRGGFDLPESDKVPAIAIGGFTYGVTQVELAGFYHIFMNNGMWLEPTFYDKVELMNPEDEFDRTLWFEVPQKSEQLISPINAYRMAKMGEEVVQNGTGTRAKAFTGGWISGKTGTAQDHTDLLWVNNTEQYTMSTWFGNDLQRGPDGKIRSLADRNQLGLQNAIKIQNIIYEEKRLSSHAPVEPEKQVIYPHFIWEGEIKPLGSAIISEMVPERDIDSFTGRPIPPRPFNWVQKGIIEHRYISTEPVRHADGTVSFERVYEDVFIPEMRLREWFEPQQPLQVLDPLTGLIKEVEQAPIYYSEYEPVYEREYYGEYVQGEWVVLDESDEGGVDALEDLN